MREKLDRYRHILGPQAERIEERVEPLAEQKLHRDRAWYREERGKHSDPFAALERIIVGAHRQQLEYASRRVAIAAVREELAANGSGPPADGPGGKEEMMAAYRRTFGDRAATSIATRASEHEPFLRQEPELLEARARQFAAPHPPRAELDQKVSDWVRDNGESATELLALERAEQQTAELERTEEVEETELGEGAVEWLSGPEINQRIERRKQDLVPEFEAMSRRELRDATKQLEADLYERGRELFEEAARLEEARAPLFAPPEEVIRKAAEAEQSAREESDGLAQQELRATADYFRQEVRADRRWRQGIENVQGRWVELHAREAALQHVAERSRARLHEPEGIGF